MARRRNAVLLALQAKLGGWNGRVKEAREATATGRAMAGAYGLSCTT